jgi:UV DNA damage endonuclease
MDTDYIGYACINTGLSERPLGSRITTNRTMIKKTFDAKGIHYASELTLSNVADLLEIVKWNEQNKIKFFRMSSEMFPWASHYNIDDMPHIEKITAKLKEVGDFAKTHNHRLTFHPGPFNKLASPKDNVVKNTITDLEIHGKIMDLMGLPRTHWAKINIHVGASYGDKPSALASFCKNVEKLSPAVRTRLTVENDDKASLYSTKELYEGVFKSTGIPIVFDYHHHKFCSGGQTEKEALELACSTWGSITPVVHYSESAREEQGDLKIKEQKHSNLIYNKINTYNNNINIMIEAKSKELSVLKYKKEILND